MSLRVKVCGLTRLEDALLAEACGAHAVGFIFYAPSPRAVEPQTAARIAGALHPYTVKVGVFVNETPARMNELAALCGLDRIQLHGGEPYALLAQLDRPAYRAFKLKDEADLAAAQAAPDATLMLDTHDPHLHGGTGRPFDWEWARVLGASRRVILAGGLSADNIAHALAVARPAAVDVSSALEAAPGRKDPRKLEAFFAALRTALADPALAPLTERTPKRSERDALAL
jgi:phosphoribosylanthranilate isomerase